MNFAVRMPESLGQTLKEVSKQDSVSINQFILTAVAEKIASLKTFDMVEQMAAKGSRKHGLEILKRVSDKEPINGDGV